MITINIANFTNLKSCIDPRKAEPLLEEIRSHLMRDELVYLSFAGLDRIITAFLNVAIGKLYDPELGVDSKVDKLLVIIDADEADIVKVEQVKKFARIFYEDPDFFEDIAEEA